MYLDAHEELVVVPGAVQDFLCFSKGKLGMVAGRCIPEAPGCMSQDLARYVFVLKKMLKK